MDDDGMKDEESTQREGSKGKKRERKEGKA